MPSLRRLGAAALAAAAVAGPALAHGTITPGAPPGWTTDPWVTAPLAVSAGLYAVGWLRLRRRAEGGRERLARGGLLFAGGWILLAGALVSPLHQAGERSFAAHMLEHELLMLGAAPLLVAARPAAALLWAFPMGGRRLLAGLGRGPVNAAWRALTEPITATLVQAAALWLWHAPSLFDLALASDGWHIVQHVCFFGSALLFWSAMLHDRRGRGAGLAAICLFATSVVTGALGAFMTFSVSPWYAGYAALGLAPMGLTPTEDQQLAGLLMWVPGGLVHAVAALAILARLFRNAPEPG